MQVLCMAKGCMAVTRGSHPQNANTFVSGGLQIYGPQTIFIKSMGNQRTETRKLSVIKEMIPCNRYGALGHEIHCNLQPAFCRLHEPVTPFTVLELL